MVVIHILIGLVVGIVGTLIVTNNKNAIAQKALVIQQNINKSLQTQLDNLAKKV